MEIRQWLEMTSAADVMQRNVVTLMADDLLADAAAVLLGEQITGAPVLDESGACVGILSAIDVLCAEEKVAEGRREVAESSFFNSNLALPASVFQDRLAQVRDKIAPAAEQPVQRFMTTDVVSVNEDTRLVTVIQNMVNAHIHRVVVLNEQRQLRGIISTTDIVAALLRQ